MSACLARPLGSIDIRAVTGTSRRSPGHPIVWICRHVHTVPNWVMYCCVCRVMPLSLLAGTRPSGQQLCATALMNEHIAELPLRCQQGSGPECLVTRMRLADVVLKFLCELLLLQRMHVKMTVAAITARPALGFTVILSGTSITTSSTQVW
jgi:hypothetical protein